jgi:hypothetical protein
MLRNTLNTFMTATFIMLLGVSSTAQAMVPANSRITSTSTLTVEGLEPLTATVTVTVGLQRSKPVIALKAGTADQLNPSSAKWINETTESLTYTYTITTTANGPANYTVKAEAAAEAVENLNKKPKVRLNDNKESITITLGATAVLKVVGNEITVPSDGKFDGAVPKATINGIKAGATVKINGQSYSVTEVVDDTGIDATITLGIALPEGIERGTLIAEQAEFTVNLREVSLNTDVSDQTTVGLTVTATQGEGFADLDDTDERSFLVIAPRDPEMQMYVRNLSEEPGRNPASDAGDSETYPEDGGSAYFKTDLVNTNPGDTLEYLVTITAGNGGPLNAGPYQRPETPFLEYVAGTTALNAASLADNEITAGVNLKAAGFAYADAEATQIAKDRTAYVTYQMTVIGGVGGDVDLPLTPEEIELACNGDSPQLFSIETCKGQPWVAANGVDVATNPVCWDRDNYGGWQVDGKNPWVVGTATEDNNAAYDCRTKCAGGMSGGMEDHCAADGWWDRRATSTHFECQLTVSGVEADGSVIWGGGGWVWDGGMDVWFGNACN